MGDKYVDYDGGSDSNNGDTDSTPYKLISTAYTNVTAGAVVYIKRAVIHPMTAAVSLAKAVTFGDYGSGAKPILTLYNTAAATTNTGPLTTGEWTEVDPVNPTTAQTSTGLWAYKINATTNQYVQWVRLGTIDIGGRPIEVDTRNQIGDGAVYPSAEWEWGSADSGGAGYLWVYSSPGIDPVSYYGAVYFTKLNQPMFITDERDDTAWYSLDFRHGLCGVRVRIDADGVPANHVFHDCNGYNLRNLWAMSVDTPSAARGLTGGRITSNTVSHSDAAAFYFAGGCQGTVCAYNTITHACKAVSNGGIYIDNLYSASTTPLLIKHNHISYVDHGHFWVADGGAIETDSIVAPATENNLIIEGNTIEECFEAVHNNSGGSGVDVRFNLIKNCDRAYLESDSLGIDSSNTKFRHNTCIVYGYNQIGTYGGSTASQAIAISFTTASAPLAFTYNTFYKVGSTDSKLFLVNNTLYLASNFTENHNLHYGFTQSSLRGSTAFSLDATDATLTGFDSTTGMVSTGSNAHGAGTWIAGAVAPDDLPLPLHPDIGAVQDRNAAGRKFGVGGGAL